jgi:hypothetical protein
MSHTWGKGEVTFQGISTAGGAAPNDEAELDFTDKVGFNKILQCCEQSLKMGILYTWIDTCCTNKSSSSKLLEAINSMYKWYQDAAVCFVYLADVHTTKNDTFLDESFAKSR